MRSSSRQAFRFGFRLGEDCGEKARKQAGMREKLRPKSTEELTPKLDQQICFAIYSTLHALNRAYSPLLRKIGLTYPQYLVMLVLWEGNDVTVKTIGERLQLDSGTLTPVLKRLEAMGLAHRARDPKDERQVRVKLSENGERLRRAAKTIPAQIARATGRSDGDLKTKTCAKSAALFLPAAPSLPRARSLSRRPRRFDPWSKRSSRRRCGEAPRRS